MSNDRSGEKQGRLTTNGVLMQSHEYATINVLLGFGYDVELTRPSSKLGVRSADFIMNGLEWEMKSPKGAGKYTIRDMMRVAA